MTLSSLSYLNYRNVARNGLENPYGWPAPAGTPLFFGREDCFYWIQRNLASYVRDTPLLLYGLPGSGKTAILGQLAAGRFDTPHIFAYIPLSQLPVGNFAELLYGVAEAVAASLQGQQITVFLPARRDFAPNPAGAFQERVIPAILTALPGRSLVLMFDDMDQLTKLVSDKSVVTDLLSCLHGLSQHNRRVRYLFTFTGREEPPAGELLAPFSGAISWAVGPLDGESALTLIRQPAPYKIYDEVARYIADVTGNYPADLMRVCGGLYTRWQHHQLGQITITDVNAVIRLDLNRDEQRVLRRHAPPVRIIATPTSPPSASSRPLWQSLALLLLLLTVGLVAIGFALPAGMRAGYLSQFTATLTPIYIPAPPIAAAVPTVNLVRPRQTAIPTATSRPDTPTPAPSPSPSSASLLASPVPTITPTATPILEFVRPQDGMVMVYVPAGTFLMGSAEGDINAGEDEQPQHPVTLSPFYMDKFEVNVAQYVAFLNDLGNYAGACYSFDCTLPVIRVGSTSFIEETIQANNPTYTAVAGFENYPVNYISWYGASAYCAAVGGRLPTEAEWEYAARGTDGRLYPWGNAQPDRTKAVFNSSGIDNLLPVDALPAGASPFGILGMAGGVWEWVSDWYEAGYYFNSPIANPTGPDNGPGRSARGGAWPNNNQADRIRSTNRNLFEPDFLSSTIGFRCVTPVDN